MLAMLLHRAGTPLSAWELPEPQLGPQQILLRVAACGVCRTDLHVVDGELTRPKLPLVPGHEIVGTVERQGSEARRFTLGQRVGVPWLAGTCGHCRECLAGRENLCPQALFTGYTVDGGYAELAAVDERYALALPERYSDLEAAPLLCAGLIGYRSLKAAGDGQNLGLYGFGAAAHLICQVACQQGRNVFAFTRPGDTAGQQFALSLGAAWAGASTDPPPEPLDAAILFAPVGALVPAALAAVAPGGTVVCAGIHMSDIPTFEYRRLWGERVVRSVANLTRRDGEEFMALAARLPLRTHATSFPLTAANQALDALRAGRVAGAAVLVP